MNNKLRFLVFSALTILIISAIAVISDFDSFVKIEKTVSLKKEKLDQMRLKDQWSEKKKKVKGEARFDSPDKFYEFHQLIRTGYNEEQPSYPPNYRFSEYKKAKNVKSLQKSSAVSALEWVERGPANVGGRTRGLIVDPDDPTKNTWFAGSVGGGVWKTSDAGATWTLLTTDIPNLSTSVLAMAASNPDVIYVGTGEGFFNADAIDGDGIFKTTDRGESWTQLASTVGNSNFRAVNRIVVDPADEDIAVAVTNTGVFKTTDGGTTWIEKYDAPNRVQDLRANPLNFNTLYATVNSNGIIKSTDAGDTWTQIFSGLSGNRFEIAIAPTDTNRLYISAESSPSKLYMSQDGGLSWLQVAELNGTTANWLGAQGWYDNTIEVHPYDENVTFVGGIDLWKAEIIFDSTKTIVDADTVGTGSFLSFKPTPDFEFLGGGVGTGEVYFDEQLANDEDYVNVEIRFGPGKTQKAHRFTLGIYQYEDYVDIPFEVWDVENNRQLMVSFQDLLKNGEYNVSITVGDVLFVHSMEYDANNPDPNIAVDEGVKYKNLYVVTAVNATGVSWNPDNHPDSYISITQGYMPVLYKNINAISDGYGQYPTNEYVHVDHHNIVMIPVDEQSNSFRILNANDGGVAISNDGGNSWTEVGDNAYNTTQFYGMDKAPGVDRYAGGTQDNGTWVSPAAEDASKTTDYTFVIGGDGFEVSWHYQDINKIIGGSQFNRFFRTTDGTNYFAANDGFDDWGTGNSPFISKIAKSQADPDLLFTISRQGVWRTDNFAENWTLTPITTNFQSGGFFTFAQVNISIADPQVVWAGAYMTTGDRIHVSKDGGLTFNVTNSWGNLGNVSGLDTHPTDPATAYLTFSINNAPKILRTTDYGNSWEDITGFGSGGPSTNGFPNVATYSVLVMPYDTDIIWAGTDIGIVESTDGGATWALADNGLPAVSIWDMRIVDDQVVVGTHGRGIWSVTLPELAGYGPPDVTLSPRINGKVVSSPAGVTVNASLRSPYDSTRIKAGNNILATIYNNESAIDTAIVINTALQGTYSISMESYKDSRLYKSSSQSVTLLQYMAAKSGYVNNLNSATDDFYSEGFTLDTPAGFNNSAYHSPHPYDNLNDYVLILRVPIVVAASNAILTYDDIAIVEEGDPGTEFGDEGFWDYVIVEGSNGTDWIPLADGYDARADADWLNAYQNSLAGNSSLFRTQTVNLLNTFSAGDTVVIRFRLFTDPFVTGWGWAIDNISVQPTLVGIENVSAIPERFELSQNYPNPFNPTTTINYKLPAAGKVTLRIFDMKGSEVARIDENQKPAGNYKIKFDAGNLASGVYIYRLTAGDFTAQKKMILLK